MLLTGILIGIIVLNLIVVAHELGHALVGKKYGTVVEEFGIGFPPKAWSKKVKKSFLGDNVEFSINWLPLGGFVRFQGEHDAAAKKGDYGAMTFWQKTQVLLAGVVVNWLLAAFLISVLAVIGLPKILPNQFTVASDTQIIKRPVELAAVAADMPAAKAGLKEGDKIVRFDNQSVATPDDLAALAASRAGKKVQVIYLRNDVESTTTVKLRSNNDDKKGYLGAGPAQRELVRATWSAPIVGVAVTAQATWATIEGLGQLLANTATGLVMKLVSNEATQAQANQRLGEAGASVAGPLAIFGVIFPAAEKAGPTYVIMIAAIISLTLAVMNALPIPALDGGRWFVTAVYKLLKKPLTKEAEEKIHGTGFMILLLLIVVITIADIGKLL
jgi:regulator of sigma E protease